MSRDVFTTETAQVVLTGPGELVPGPSRPVVTVNTQRAGQTPTPLFELTSEMAFRLGTNLREWADKADAL